MKPQAPDTPEITERHRLPVTHPDFLYLPSQNPYYSKLQSLDRKVAMNEEAERLAGQWRAQLDRWRKAAPNQDGRRRELHVEIGCNGGHVTLEWAARHPDADYIGIDWKFKQIYFAYEKSEKRAIHNVLFMRARAERTIYIFGPEEIDHLYLFFPDPWERKSDWKNRYITAEWLLKLAPLVRRGGTFWIKTDHEGYFDWILEAIEGASASWRVTESTRDLHATCEDPTALKIPDVTLFERIWIRDGMPIKSVRLERI